MKYKHQSVKETCEITLRLDQYDDIFSDFDMRPYSKRALSIDFLDEIKRASVDKSDDGIELILNAPEKERNESHENTIKERLDAHFKRHFNLESKEKQRVVRLGITMVVLGVICMIAATLVMFEDPSQNLFLSFLVVFLEPAAWFLLWEGMDQLIFNSKNINPELDFYRKMAESRIHFQSY
jgi:hypothetical protein